MERTGGAPKVVSAALRAEAAWMVAAVKACSAALRCAEVVAMESDCK